MLSFYWFYLTYTQYIDCNTLVFTVHLKRKTFSPFFLQNTQTIANNNELLTELILLFYCMTIL